MKKDEKQNLTNLIVSGKLKAAIEGLLALELPGNKKNEVRAISFRYNELKSKERTGILSFEQAKTSENQIAHSLIDLIKKNSPRLCLVGASESFKDIPFINEKSSYIIKES